MNLVNPKRWSLAVLGTALLTALLLLTACEEPIGSNPAGDACPGPDDISADGRWVLTSPAIPGPVRLMGRGPVDGVTRQNFAEGYGIAVNADGTVVTAFSRQADSGVVWRLSPTEYTVVPKPAGTTLTVPTSITDDGRIVGLTAAAVPGGPMSGHVYDTEQRRTTPVAGAENITQLLVDRSGTHISIVDTDGVIHQIERGSGAVQTVATVSPHNPEPIEAVSRDGRLIVYNEAADTRDARLRVWDAATGTHADLPAPLSDGVAIDRVHIDGDGRYLTATVFDANGNEGEVIRLRRTDGDLLTYAEVKDSGRSVISDDGAVTAYCRPDGPGDRNRNIFARNEAD